ncbi:MAG TPA: SOS response-associated peptidase family protein [Isosphaeraceae bacterium]|nr:SOS response-associated peptidase family protein [Isosphaeraceae bacterium]
MLKYGPGRGDPEPRRGRFTPETRPDTPLTTDANDLVSPVHRHRPVSPESEQYSRQLDPRRRQPQDVHARLRPGPAERIIGYPVGRWVNDPRHDDPRCVVPAT